MEERGPSKDSIRPQMISALQLVLQTSGDKKAKAALYRPDILQGEWTWCVSTYRQVLGKSSPIRYQDVQRSARANCENNLYSNYMKRR